MAEASTLKEVGGGDSRGRDGGGIRCMGEEKQHTHIGGYDMADASDEE